MKLLETLMRPIGDVRTIKALLTGAENEALRDGQTTPGAEHLFLSALALPEGSARRAFARIGIDPDGLRAAITAQHVEALGAIGIDAAPEDSDRGVEIPAPGS